MSLLLLFSSSSSSSAPSVTTDSITAVGRTSVLAAGTVLSAGSSPITERGFVISSSINPTILDTKFVVAGTTGSFTSTLTGLLSGAGYHVRAYATSSVGTSYGADISFNTAVGQITKHFIYRVYTAGVYVETWTKEVISEPSFQTVINGGPGEMLIELGRKFDDFGEDEDVKLNNKVECWVVDHESPNGQLFYSGYISGYKPIIEGVTEKIQITVLGFVAQLQRMILRDLSGNTTIAYLSADPSAILMDVIDKFRALGGSLNYSATSIALTNTVVSYTFNTNTIKECLDKIIELTPFGWYYRIDADGTVYMQPEHSSAADHTFTIGLDIENLETFRRIEDLVNRVLVVGGGSPALFRKYENTGSQDTYGLYELLIVDQRVTLAATAAILAQRQLDARSSPEIRSSFTIVDSNGPGSRGYDIESVKVGQTLRVRNLKAGVKTVTLWDVAFWDTDVWDQTLTTSAADIIQILSVNYSPDSIKIEASSRLPQIAKRIEDIERNLEVTQTLNNPSAPV